MRYCNKCLYPINSVNLMINEDGKCNACTAQEQFDQMTDEFWTKREEIFIKIIDKAKAKSASNFDCVVPVSGGKDSYFQVDKILEYGLKPLLVTYHGNNYLQEGQRNLDRMREKLGADHLIFGPNVNILRNLNRACFELMGDMNWHAHAGIKTYPMMIAVKFNIPIVVWGEITWSISGMFDPNDYVQYNKRTVLEHDMRGYTAFDMIDKIPGLSKKDLNWLEMPSDKEIDEAGTIGIYIGNFFKWDPNEHAKKMREKYGFEFAQEPFERTYRIMSNLDDMHENGIHDYMKFVKFGYGRATDHASKDIRTGYMSRDEGIEMVRKYDHVKPVKDLNRWLEYVSMTEQEFDSIADKFRDPRVWWIENGEWKKDNIWGCASSFGKVKLEREMWRKYER